jgi:hypothetical protein
MCFTCVDVCAYECDKMRGEDTSNNEAKAAFNNLGHLMSV